MDGGGHWSGPGSHIYRDWVLILAHAGGGRALCPLEANGCNKSTAPWELKVSSIHSFIFEESKWNW